MKPALVLLLSLILGAPIAAPTQAQTSCPLFAGIDLARYLGGPATFGSDRNGSICLARRGFDSFIKAQVQDDKEVVATEPQRKAALPLICKKPDTVECAIARKSIGLKSARQGYDAYKGVARRAPSYRPLSGIGDDAFEYGFDLGSDGRGAQLVALVRGSIVAVTMEGATVSPDVALREIPEIARVVVANIK